MPATEKTRKLRYGAPGDVQTFVQTYTASDDVAAGRIRLVQRERYSRGGGIQPADIAAVVAELEKRPWVRWIRSQMSGGQGEPSVRQYGAEPEGPRRLTDHEVVAVANAIEAMDWAQWAIEQSQKTRPASPMKSDPGQARQLASENVAKPVPKLKLSPTAMEPMRPTAPGEDTGDFTFSNRKPQGRYGKPGEPERYSERHAHLSSAIEIEPAGSPVRLDFMAARREAYAAEQANREERSSQVARYAKACHCSFDEAAARLGYTVGMPVG